MSEYNLIVLFVLIHQYCITLHYISLTHYNWCGIKYLIVQRIKDTEILIFLPNAVSIWVELHCFDRVTLQALIISAWIYSATSELYTFDLLLLLFGFIFLHYFLLGFFVTYIQVFILSDWTIIFELQWRIPLKLLLHLLLPRWPRNKKCICWT